MALQQKSFLPSNRNFIVGVFWKRNHIEFQKNFGSERQKLAPYFSTNKISRELNIDFNKLKQHVAFNAVQPQKVDKSIKFLKSIF